MDQSLSRFEDAQRDEYPTALRELRLGQKRSHWMWFIFPQLRGLGKSQASWYFGISNLKEAEDYLLHPRLGPRLVECTRVVLGHQNRSVAQIFPHPDELKFVSCMTLFSLVSTAPPEFRAAIDRLLDGKRDERTITLLGGEQI